MGQWDYNIVLIGFMGTGKSTVAACLGAGCGMKIVEMDEEIVSRQGRSIADIFAVQGEEYFRDLETELLKDLQKSGGQVISCGGGAALREENVVQMKKNGRVVLLTAKPQTIYERVKEDEERPLLKEHQTVEYIAQMMEKRRPKYEAAADIVIATDEKSAEQIGREIIEKLARLDENHV